MNCASWRYLTIGQLLCWMVVAIGYHCRYGGHKLNKFEWNEMKKTKIWAAALLQHQIFWSIGCGAPPFSHCRRRITLIENIASLFLISYHWAYRAKAYLVFFALRPFSISKNARTWVNRLWWQPTHTFHIFSCHRPLIIIINIDDKIIAIEFGWPNFVQQRIACQIIIETKYF